MSQFMPTGHGNDLLAADGFKVSYRADTRSLGSAFQGDGGSEETALMVEGKFFILNGDFRTEYLVLAEDGLDACLRFFLGKQDLRSSWSGSAEEASAFLCSEEQ